MQKKIDGFNTMKDIAMYFHSSFRNVGLYTSIGFASSAASKHTSITKTSKIILVIVSMVLVFVSVLLNLYLFNRLYRLHEGYNDTRLWIMTTVLMFIIQLTIMYNSIDTIYQTIKS